MGKENFDIHEELSNLVSRNVLPQKLADRIEKKLKEKNISLTKEQLHHLVDEVLSLIKTRSTGDMETTRVEIEDKTKTVEKPPSVEEERPQVITTEDIQIPGENIKVSQVLQRDPLMEIPSDPENIIVLMNWLQFLIDKCGRDNLREILDYYVAINWITEDVKFHLLEYSRGISEQKRENTKNRKNIRELPSQDHIQSFLFIQKLKGRNLDKHFLERVNSEITRLVKQTI